jgi:hypothetical protein
MGLLKKVRKREPEKPPAPPAPGPRVKCRKCGKTMEVRMDLIGGMLKLKCDSCGAAIPLAK